MQTPSRTGDRRVESQARYARHKDRLLAESKARYRLHREKILAQVKKYAESHKDSIRDYNKQWRAKNRELNLAKKRAYHHAHRQRILEKKRQYRLRNIEWCRRKESEYHKNHPDVLRASSSKRRATIRGNQVDVKGIKAWMSEVRTKPFARCHWCGTKVRGRKIHFDHVVAISQGGSHTIGNLCVACELCNSSKHARAIADWICNGQKFLL